MKIVTLLTYSLAVIGLLVSTFVKAAVLVQQKTYFESETCEDPPQALGYVGVANQCIPLSATESIKHTCTSSQTFNTIDCTGSATVTEDFAEGCDSHDAGESQIRECVSFPDHKIGLFQIGDTCPEGDGIDTLAQLVFILDVCQPAETQYIMHTLTNDETSIIQTYSVNADCSDPAVTLTFPIGPCEMRDDLPHAFQELAIRFTPAVEGATLSQTPPPTEPPTEATQSPTASPVHDDEDDGNNPGNGSSATIGTYTSVLAIAATAIGALAVMF